MKCENNTLFLTVLFEQSGKGMLQGLYSNEKKEEDKMVKGTEINTCGGSDVSWVVGSSADAVSGAAGSAGFSS